MKKTWCQRTAQLVSLFVLTVAAVAVAAESASPVAKPFDPLVVDRFITTQLARHHIPGLALAITHGDRVVLVRGYGEARDGQPITGQTPFRIASLSKTFTALAVMQHVEAGQIELDAPVKRYLPGFALLDPSAAERITVRQLLNHTSGLADAGFVSGLNGGQKTLADRMASLRQARPLDAPGTVFHYFDPNYQVLARLVEAVSGQAFDTYLQQRVFAPLDMRATTSALTSVLSPDTVQRLAQGHVVAYGEALALPELVGFLGGSGGVVSTASDMAHILIAQGNHGRYSGKSGLSPQGVSRMQTPPTGVASSYGMGWVASNVNGTPAVEHSGILSTYYADAVLLPEQGFGLVLLYNVYALTASATAFPEIKNGVLALLLGQVPAEGKISLRWLGRGLAALSALGTGLALWALLRLSRSVSPATPTSRWKLGWGLLWSLAPVLLLIGLPRLLVLPTGRYFDLEMLARAMPELVILLGTWGLLGLLCGVVRLTKKVGTVRAGAQMKRPRMVSTDTV